MCVEWDPIKEANILPDTWKFLYCFEVWHRRSIPLDVFSARQNADTAGVVASTNHANATNTSSVGGTPARKKSWFSPYRTPKAKMDTHSIEDGGI